jgi:hypothetical protein
MATPADPADDAGFLSRWSRRKALARSGQPLAEAPARPVPTPAGAASLTAPAAMPATPAATAATVATTSAAPAAAAVVAEPVPVAPTLDDVAALTPESSFARFVQQGVAAPVRNAALKKLFSDPHFNLMDGLDIYIDDYGLPDPLAPELLAQMSGNHFLGFAQATEPETAEASDAASALPPTQPAAAPDSAAAVPDSAPATDGATPPPTEPLPCDEDPDLRLQPDPAPGRPCPAPDPGQDPGGEHRGA